MLPDNQHRFRMILQIVGHPESFWKGHPGILFRIGHPEILFRIGYLGILFQIGHPGTFQIGHLGPFQINHLGLIWMKTNKIRPNYWKLLLQLLA